MNQSYYDSTKKSIGDLNDVLETRCRYVVFFTRKGLQKSVDGKSQESKVACDFKVTTAETDFNYFVENFITPSKFSFDIMM